MKSSIFGLSLSHSFIFIRFTVPCYAFVSVWQPKLFSFARKKKTPPSRKGSMRAPCWLCSYSIDSHPPVSVNIFWGLKLFGESNRRLYLYSAGEKVIAILVLIAHPPTPTPRQRATRLLHVKLSKTYETWVESYSNWYWLWNFLEGKPTEILLLFSSIWKIGLYSSQFD